MIGTKKDEGRLKLRRICNNNVFFHNSVRRPSDSQGSQLISLSLLEKFRIEMNTKNVLPISQDRQNFFPAKFEE